jgi:hypothetical protein
LRRPAVDGQRRACDSLIGTCLDFQFVVHLHDASDAPGERNQELALVEAGDDAGERHHAKASTDRETSAAGVLALLNEQCHAVLQFTISRRAIGERQSNHSKVPRSSGCSEMKSMMVGNDNNNMFA